MATNLDRPAQSKLDLLDTGKFADAEIVCNGITWKVHKAILVPSCARFEMAFGSNSKIHLDEEQPERVNHLLNFFYSEQYIPTVPPTVQCFSAPVLESTVALWCTADQFLVPALKTKIEVYLLERFATILRIFHTSVRSPNSPYASQEAEMDDATMDAFFTDVSKAVAKTYESPATTELRKLFAAFFCGLHENFPTGMIWDLTKSIPEFQQDVSNVLLGLQFPQLTECILAEPLHLRHNEQHADRRVFRCTACTGKFRADAHDGETDMILDPFSKTSHKWCGDCAFLSMKDRVSDICSEWPEDLRAQLNDHPDF